MRTRIITFIPGMNLQIDYAGWAIPSGAYRALG
jgi:hypothetical protein